MRIWNARRARPDARLVARQHQNHSFYAMGT
eukprot:SAG31_NODE_35958_length_318_cov_0.593607_1_plen_30_part_01